MMQHGLALSRRALIAGSALTLVGAAPIAPINTAGDQLGDPLDTSDFLEPNFTAGFKKLPDFARRVVRPEPPRPLTDPAFEWVAGYIHATRSPGVPDYVARNGPIPAFSWLSSELAIYPNGDAIAAGGYSPFSIAHDALVITADHTPAAMRPLIPAAFAHDYISGAINSYPFSQTYGYFELRGRPPKGQGLWPAFWLMPVDMSWPPEIDVMEVLGHEPNRIFTTVHSRKFATGTQIGFGTRTADLSADDHLFGVDWGPERMRFYVDRRLVFTQPTPEDCRKPFYIIANLAVGGPTSWPRAPDQTTPFPAHFRIASIQAWQRRRYQ
ncbi:MAG: glycoside hydrolase family 16 protein [Acetobacteraceae bacterium]|nr:glycoside hydrolase family 16 protein [Acetobacteraceae bacterium]